MNKPGKVYLIPSVLDEAGFDAIPFYILTAVKRCDVFFVENERSARRYLKKLWKVFLPEEEIIIDKYEWHTISDSITLSEIFRQKIKEGKTIGIISEVGCPGVADPGQSLVTIAHEMEAEVKPLVGPGSVLLSLMASAMNGQRFQFAGYLPIKDQERIKTIKELEMESKKKTCTQIFIETPYRNNQLLDALLKTCKPSTRLCIAVDLTSASEMIKTKTIMEWKDKKPDLHKRPAIFLIQAE